MDFRSGRSTDKFMVWVDAVGGYWVCLRDEAVIGQPVPGGTVDLPILGDISSRHARICRDGEGYFIEAIRKVKLEGRRIERMATLADGNEITLGDAVRLKFRRSHPLSATARLDFVSHHRTQPSSDAAVLMADSFILGPKPKSHVVCRDWPQEVVLYRQGDQLMCRTAGRLEIDGVVYENRGRVFPNSHVQGDGFSLTLEPLGD